MSFFTKMIWLSNTDAKTMGYRKGKRNLNPKLTYIISILIYCRATGSNDRKALTEYLKNRHNKWQSPAHMALEKYRQKRDASTTPEPFSGKARTRDI